MGRKTVSSYRELEARKKRASELEKIYMDMAMQKELQVLTSKTWHAFKLLYLFIENIANKTFHFMLEKGS